MKISIIIPCYNEKNTLINIINKIILSLNNHKFKFYEILIVDDNSSDSTIDEIYSFFWKKNINYRLIKHSKNLGVAQARNSLINHAKGEFLAFFDSDDISYKNRISIMEGRPKFKNLH